MADGFAARVPARGGSHLVRAIVPLALAAIPALALAGSGALASCGGERGDVATRRNGASDSLIAAAALDTLGRAVAITFDDLPGVGTGGLRDLQYITDTLLAKIRASAIPAIGFVNEQKLEGVQKQARTALLVQWLDAGLELGNHTYSHPKFYDTPLAEYQTDVLRGERVMRDLLTARGLPPPRYFRHPYLNTGPDLESKRAFERFLARHGYAIAPVTIDSDEWIYAAAYRDARARADSMLMQRIGDDYVRYMDETFAFYERLSLALLDREPAQVLLLHANALNADYLDELVRMMARRGYEFIALDEALDDPAYELADRYTGAVGPSWLQRWALTRGADPGEAPEAAGWVRRVARL